ncbi:Plasma kallikrein [Bulinus truncatus]|nr:Plasma kallikrein [Bulinus truncatus]
MTDKKFNDSSDLETLFNIGYKHWNNNSGYEYHIYKNNKYYANNYKYYANNYNYYTNNYKYHANNDKYYVNNHKYYANNDKHYANNHKYYANNHKYNSNSHKYISRYKHINYTQELAKPSSVTVNVGSSNRNKTKPYFVQTIAFHPRYKHSYKDYDVAVLTLSESLVFTNCTAPICLPSVGEDARDTSYCQAAGWGLTFDTAKTLPYDLMKVLLPVVENSLCLLTYGSLRFNELKICAGDMYYGGIDTCDGDSGGPLMCFDDGRYVLHGITSFSVSPTCGNPRYIGIYTRVANSEILTFILSNIN